jgi:hypothetical protein
MLRKLPNTARLSCDVALLTAPADKPGPPTFRIDPAYTGGPVKLAGWPLPLIIDLATLTNAKRIIGNMDHERKQRVGHVTEVQNDGKQVKLAGLISAATDASRELVEASANGYPFGGSIEVAFAARNVAELAPGKTATVNGKTAMGPVLIGRNGVLFGVAFSDHPADDATDVQIAAATADGSPRITLAEMKARAT